jgi:hypothetical protein
LLTFSRPATSRAGISAQPEYQGLYISGDGSIMPRGGDQVAFREVTCVQVVRSR